MEKYWYHLADIDQIDSPALVVYLDRVRRNIDTLLSMTKDVNQLRPHVKTHKSPHISKMLIDKGIQKFKCATIAEAEMLGEAGALDVLLAYPIQGPKIDRLIALMQKYPQTKYSCLVDNRNSAKEISNKTSDNGTTVCVFIDLNVGMNRTGLVPGTQAIDLIKDIEDLKGIRVIGLHAYDGHIRNVDLDERKEECDKAFRPVLEMNRELQAEGYSFTIVAGGSPTFPIHVRRMNVECSPGTFIYWDKGYQDNCPEQDFLPAALVVSRVISNPAPNIFCLDLGHKSIAPENPLHKRVHFYNGPEMNFIGQSEEHLVVELQNNDVLQVGDVLYGVPIHICPTVALYDDVLVSESGQITNRWPVVARDRMITV